MNNTCGFCEIPCGNSWCVTRTRQWQIDQVLQKFNPYFDENGVLCHLQDYGFDGGDAPLRCGMYALLLRRLGIQTSYFAFIAQMEVFNPKPTILRRYDKDAPDAGQPGVRDFAQWSNPKVFSRDQAIGLAFGMGVYQCPIYALKNYVINNNSRTANSDLVFWHWNAILRAQTYRWYLYPLVSFFDCFYLLGVCINYLKIKLNKPKPSDIAFCYFQSLQNEMFQPTVVSKFGRWLVRKLGFKGKTIEYFRNNKTAPPFAELIELIED